MWQRGPGVFYSAESRNILHAVDAQTAYNKLDYNGYRGKNANEKSFFDYSMLDRVILLRIR